MENEKLTASNIVTGGFLVISNVIEELDEKNKKIEAIKKADFIDFLNKLGKQDVAEQVKIKGLPSDIYVSSDIYAVAYKYLNIYAKVTENKLIKQGDNILMAWNVVNTGCFMVFGNNNEDCEMNSYKQRL